MNKFFKRSMALMLVLVMTFTLCACGSKTEKTEEDVVPEYTYASSFKSIENNTNLSLYATYTDDTGFYCMTNERVGKEIPEGAVEEWEGQYDVYELRLYKIDFEGNMTLISGYSPIQLDDDRDYSSYCNNMCTDGNGGLVVCENVNINWNEAPEGITSEDMEYWDYYRYEESYYLRHIAADGSEISCAEIAKNNSDGGSYFYIYDMEADSSGNIYLACDMEGVKVYDADGNQLFTIEGGGEWVDNLVKMPDGRVGALQWSESGYSIKVIDPAAKAYGESYALGSNAWSAQSGGGDYDFYYSSGVSFYGYKLDTGKEERLFSWIACDVNNDNFSNFYVDSNGNVYALSNEWDKSYENVKTELVCVSKVPYDSVPHKETIVLATNYLDYNLRPYVIDFNRNNPNVRIDVKEYSDISQLNTEIMAGNVPDLIDSNTIPLERLAAKGLLADLYPYLDADKDLSRDDFFKNILESVEFDGKLCSTVSSFSVQTVAGAGSIVGNTPGWTYEQLYEAMSKMPEGCTVFDNYMTRDTVIAYGLYLEGSSLIDWATGECNFDSQTFKSMLEFAKRFPAVFDWDNEVYVDSYEAIAQGKQMLLNAYIYGFEDVMQYPALFGGDICFVGFPTYNGVGNMIRLDNGYAMFEGCKNKDAAWEFLRIMFTEKFQDDCYDLPANINSFEKKIKEAQKPQYRTDADGNYVLDENGEKIEDPKYMMGWGDGNMIPVYSLSDEMAQTIRDIVSSTTKIVSNDDEIYQIVLAEAEPFFLGQKSVDDVAKLIQNKVNIYVNEQR